MPPSRSGIADYSEALVAELRKIAEIEIFSSAGCHFDPSRFDAAIYHLGNNPHHDFVYDAALAHPGILVMHEANLHHLIAHVTIRRNNWDAYVAEAELNGGAPARHRAELARTLTVGPDYEGCKMIRRVLDSAKGVIVHSQFMVNEMLAAGYRGPIVVIPHGAWVPQVDGSAYRKKLGLSDSEPLVGVFGHLKPYKRIKEALRAFRRVNKEIPAAKMILVGEPHPEVRLDSLPPSVQLIGFAEIDEFVGYMAACDIVLNLRFPTVGESSGSLLRAMGLGKAVLVSDLGSFSEFPDDTVLKVPVNAQEEEVLFEYLRLLVSRPDLSRALGQRAKAYVEESCNWNSVAAAYIRFLETLAQPPAPAPRVDDSYILNWAKDEGARSYIAEHKIRLVKTLEMIPEGSAEQSILEMGAYMQITPALKTRLGYGYVRGCYFGKAGIVEHKAAESESGERFECDIDLFDAERDRFPYADQAFDTVVCGELIEHLPGDPMHLMSEVNRILKPGGHFLITTPNIASIHGIAAILNRNHPGFFVAYLKPGEDGTVDARHAREYTPGEIYRLMLDGGFEIVSIETGAFGEDPHPEHDWVWDLLKKNSLATDLRGDGIYCLGRKVSGVLQRWPDWLYVG
jgi:glycosyltransferase involved in cell wall biosynthesis/SAM-dependent methyltransferase